MHQQSTLISRGLLKLAGSIPALVVPAFLAGCGAAIPCPADYGTTSRHLRQTPSYAYLPVRTARVSAVQYASNGYQVELPNFDLVRAKAKSRDWCWAACIEMVLQYNEIDMNQEEIYARVKDKVRVNGNDAASVIDIVKGLWGPGATTYISNGQSNWILSDLAFDSPVLVGIKPQGAARIGHVVVLTGLDFSMGPRGEVIVHDADVYDPADGDTRSVDGCELKRMTKFMIHFRRYN